jgi:hypothetical protein
MDEKITTELRVESCTIKPPIRVLLGAKFAKPKLGDSEVLEMRASGLWCSGFDVAAGENESSHYVEGSIEYPVSLHITMYPGCPAIPVVGDNIRVTIERVSA